MKKKTIIPIKLENEYDPCGALGLIVAGCRYVNFTDHYKFQENMAELEKEIHSASRRGSLLEQTWLKWVDKRCSSWNLAEDNIIEAVKEEVVTMEVPLLADDENDNIISDDACIFDVNIPKREDLNLASKFKLFCMKL